MKVLFRFPSRRYSLVSRRFYTILCRFRLQRETRTDRMYSGGKYLTRIQIHTFFLRSCYLVLISHFMNLKGCLLSYISKLNPINRWLLVPFCSSCYECLITGKKRKGKEQKEPDRFNSRIPLTSR